MYYQKMVINIHNKIMCAKTEEEEDVMIAYPLLPDDRETKLP